MTAPRILFLLLLILISGEIFSQDKNIIDLMKSDKQKANALFRKKQYSRARDYYKKLCKRDSINPLYKLRLAECYMFLNNSEEAEKYFRQVIRNNKLIEPIHKLHYAEVLMSNGKADSAKLWYQRYNQDNRHDKRSERMMVQAGAINKLFKDSLAYTIYPVSFNSFNADFGTVYYKKGIVFLSARKSPAFVRNTNPDNTYFLDLYYTEPQGDTSFTDPVEFHEDLNFSLHDGPVTFFDNGTKAILGRNLKGIGEKKLGLYYGEYQEKGNRWTNMEELPFCSKSYNVSHPYFHEPTKTLYFVSDMPGGHGGSDIYRSHFNNGKWSNPQNMGSVINTEKNETFPFVSSDSVLYFSSDGHGGLGSLDIFRTDLKTKNYTVTNLGYPVNSFKDDFAFVVNDKGNEGFFSSNRKHGGWDDDIYKVYINSIRVDGLVVDNLKSIGIKDAKITLINQETEEKEQFVVTNQRGAFYFHIIPGRRYLLEIHADAFKPEEIELYSNDPAQKVLKVKSQLEKYSKTYVRGRVVLNGDAAGLSKIFVFDPTADTVEVLNTDAKGEFQCQVNTDTISILMAEGQGKLGILIAQPVKRKRKASSIQFIEVPLGTLDSVKVKGIYKSKSNESPEGKLIIRNELTNREDFIECSEEGEFTLKLWDVCKYSILIQRENEKVLLRTFEPWKSKYLELTE